MIHRIGVISDTHMPPHKKIPAAVWTLFAGVEQIIHAGDLSTLIVCTIQYVGMIEAHSFYA
ncbi:metallophosphoesterase family protein [Ktedonobacter racemifer]|uniref:Calcineurin-like phosphoesterase domain-containing protein n=1 Tax=Ktedonobacter racemifer DSM 44963 TaxID=485913 RepID=D6TMA2_KTERA|nr:metallophosphoesterase family protein [Ktedonobacter racemifer]EFH86902.1 hypothetical protein Krac_8219 [Ktedonobacter racemifer DSM 44963]